MRIGVIGSGSFGTALAHLLGEKHMDVTLYGRDKTLLKLIEDGRRNVKYLPQLSISENVKTECEISLATGHKDLIVMATPSQSFRHVFTEIQPYIGRDTIIVNVAKGIEKESLLTLSQVADQVATEFHQRSQGNSTANHRDPLKYVTLSGPSHAEEVALGLPTTVSCASKEQNLSNKVQEIFSTRRFRVYTNEDLLGVELGGALKNVMALGAGISDGLGFGDNGKAALMTRGMAEISRLGVKMGAKLTTFAGLTGMGDLIVTCTSVHSRNRKCGILMGSGATLDEAVREVGMVVEGISSTFAAAALARKYQVQMPIVETIESCLLGKCSAKEAIEQLMTRELKDESPFVYI